MEITLEALLKGKATTIKDKNYFKTEEYVIPFIDEMSKFTSKFIVNVHPPTQVTITDGNEDITYNRVWIQAIMPKTNSIEEFDECFGLIYGLDVKTPIYKVYRGYVHQTSGALFVFDSNWLKINEIEEGKLFVCPIKTLMEATSNFEVKLKYIQETYLPSNSTDRHLLLGKMIELSTLMEHKNESGKVKISNAMVINAYDSVYLESDSKYFIKNNQNSTVYNYLSAFTQIIKDDKKDILNRFEKTLLVNNLFNL